MTSYHNSQSHVEIIYVHNSDLEFIDIIAYIHTDAGGASYPVTGIMHNSIFPNSGSMISSIPEGRGVPCSVGHVRSVPDNPWAKARVVLLLPGLLHGPTRGGLPPVP